MAGVVVALQVLVFLLILISAKFKSKQSFQISKTRPLNQNRLQINHLFNQIRLQITLINLPR